MSAFVYALVDPRNGDFFYIGKSIAPDRREKDHLKAAKDPHYPREFIVEELLKAGVEPRFRVLMEVPNEMINEAEKAAIAYFDSIGAPLTNLSKGGEGTNGYRWTDEQKERQSSHMREMWQNPDYVQAWKEGTKDKDKSYITPEMIAQWSGKARARWENPDIRAMYLESFAAREYDRDAMSARSKALWEDPEYKDRHVEAMRELFQDAAFREKHQAATQAGMTEEVRAHIGRKARERFADPAERERAAEKARASTGKLWQDPEYRARHAEGMERARETIRARMNETWQDPVFVAKQRAADGSRSEIMKELWADPEWKAGQVARRRRSSLHKAAERLGVGYSWVKTMCRRGQLGHREGKHWVVTDEELEAFMAQPRRGPGCTSEQAKARWARVKERAMASRPNVLEVVYYADEICGEVDGALEKALVPLGYHVENCGACFLPNSPEIERDIEFWLEGYELPEDEDEVA